MATYTARVSAVSLTAATNTTLVQVVPASNTPVRIVEVGVSFNGTTTTDVPALVELLRQSTAGTSSALTLVSEQESVGKSAVATALKTFTAEPTTVTNGILRSWYLTPAGGLFVIQFPLGREPDAMTNRIGLRVNAPSAETVSAYVTFEE